MSETRKFPQTTAQALVSMKDILKHMQAEEDREQLKGVSADDAFERGYQTAILDLEHLLQKRPPTTRPRMS